jgi:uncharacterized protein with FMN-binding domain
MSRYVAVLLTSIVVAVAPASVASATATRKVVGAAENMKFGPVTVTIFVKGRKIVNVTSVLPAERPRSQQINSQAGPLLRQEALKAQSAKIHSISGASYTSKAYAQSLQSALDKAHL